MSNDIQQWMRSLTDSVWDGFFGSLPKIMDTIGNRSSALLTGRGYKWFKNTPQNRLANAVAGKGGSSDKTIQSQESMSIERSLASLYGNTLEFGNAKITTQNIESRAKVMWRLYYDSGKDIRYKLAALSKKPTWNHPAYPFIQPVFDGYDEDSLSKDVLPFVVDRINRIPNKEFVIGD